MKALTIWQPWATLIAIGAKPYEFRGWMAPSWVCGKRIAIHAGARQVKRSEVEDLLARLALPDIVWTTGLKADLAMPLLERVLREPRCLPLSSVLCTAIIGQPRVGWDVAGEFGGVVNDSDRAGHSNYAWPLTAIEVLTPPVDAKGAQGFWNWSSA